MKDSALVARMGLPGADERAMPPPGKTAASVDEMTVIKLWVAAGASGETLVDDIKGAPKPVARVVFTDIDELAVNRQRAALAEVVKKLQSRFPNVIGYESRGSADLEINASLLGTSFGDGEFAALLPLSDHIVQADLSGTALTDASAGTLASMTHLRSLRLMNTRVTDSLVRKLGLPNTLESLTVVGTGLTESSLHTLRERGIKIYADRT